MLKKTYDDNIRKIKQFCKSNKTYRQDDNEFKVKCDITPSNFSFSVSNPDVGTGNINGTRGNRKELSDITINEYSFQYGINKLIKDIGLKF